MFVQHGLGHTGGFGHLVQRHGVIAPLAEQAGALFQDGFLAGPVHHVPEGDLAEGRSIGHGQINIGGFKSEVQHPGFQ